MSQRKIETYGHIKDGKLNISYRSKFLTALKLFDDCRVRVVVEKLYRKRTTPENAYYHAVIVREFKNGWEETQGEQITHNEAHEMLKYNCNYTEIINEDTGEVLRKGNTTTKQSTVEAEEYYDRCRAFILEWFGIIVFLPNEQSELEFDLG